MDKERESLINRRDFLTLRWARRLSNLRSENSLPGSTQEKVDKAVEYTCETFSVLAMLLLAYQATKDPAVIYRVLSESTVGERTDYPKILEAIDGFDKSTFPIKDSSSNLYQVWERAYKKLVPKTRIVRDSNGNLKTETYYEYEWHEPSELREKGVDNKIIANWISFFRNLEKRTNLLQAKSSTSFDLDAGRNALYYPETIVDGKSQRWWVMPLYGLLGLGYSFYEEIEQKRAEQNYTEPHIDSLIRIKRRSFLKLLGAGALSLMTRRLQVAFGKKNSHLLDEIKAYNDEILVQLDVTPEVNFERFFGRSPEDIRKELQEIIEKTTAVLNSGYNGKGIFGLLVDPYWEMRDGVKENLENLQKQAIEAKANFDRYFQWDEETGEYQIPEELTLATSYLWATQQMENFVRGKSLEVETRHLVNLLLMAGGLAGFVGLIENIILPASDAVIDKAEEKL